MRSVASSGQAFLIATFAVILGLSALEVTRPRAHSSRTPATTPGLSIIAVGQLPGATADMTYAYTPSRLAPIGLWGVRRNGDAYAVEGWALKPFGRPFAQIDAQALLPGGDSSSTVIAWSQARTPALVLLRDRARPVRAEALSMTTHAVLARGVSSIPPRGTDERFLSELSWPGTGPALLAIDRSPDGQTTLVVQAGALGLGRRLADLELPQALAPDAWAVAVVPRRNRWPDLALITRGPTASGHTEVHVLLGSSRYRRWGEQIATPLPASQLDMRYTVGLTATGIPILFAIDPDRQVLRLISFLPARS